jgi:uncharacterized protein (DUF58 family)
MLTSELMRKIRRIEIHTRHLVNESFAGEYHSIFKGSGMEFDEVRPYTPGDDIRSIDWNVTARMGSPYVKRFVEERELTVVLLVDASASGDFGSVGRFKRDLAAEVAAVLSFCATTNQDKVGLLIFTDRVERFIPPHKGRRHVLRIIRELLAFTPQGYGTDISLALDTVNRLLKRRSIIFLVSDFMAAPQRYQSGLAITNRRHDVIALDINDRLEEYIPPAGLLALEDAESGATQFVDTSNPAWRRAFAEHVQHLKDEKKAVLRTCGVDHIAIQTGVDYAPALTAFFHQRARRLRR